jgi:hypothetical protein
MFASRYIYEMNKVQRQLEQKDYTAIAHEHEEEQKLGKIPAHNKPKRREQKRKLAKARRDCRQAIERYERFAAARILYLYNHQSQFFSNKVLLWHKTVQDT